MKLKLVGLTIVGLSTVVSVHADEPTVPVRSADDMKLLGEFPRPGNIRDILACAGANEVVWTDARIKPSDAEVNEARGKAGWYSAVALSIFAVESSAVLKAIDEARKGPITSAVSFAKSCRKPPLDWNG